MGGPPEANLKRKVPSFIHIDNIEDIQILFKIKSRLGSGSIIFRNRRSKETNKEYRLALYANNKENNQYIK